jgi:nucleotide-binding universal stress UspA family protein
MFKNLLALVALGPAGPDLAVLEAVRALASTFGPVGGRVHVLNVTERSRGFFAQGVVAAPAPELLLATARALQADGIDARAVHVSGRLAEAVERIVQDEQIDLVIVGRPARGWGDHGLRVVRLSDAPVLVMPEGARLRRGRAVIGMDFSSNALRAYAVARELFDEVTPVAVVDPEGEQADIDVLQRQVRETWTKLAGADAAELRIDASPKPAEALLAATKDADLLAVGSRGLTPLAAVLLGSTAEKLGARCGHPLLVYRDPGTRKSLLQSLMGAAG